MGHVWRPCRRGWRGLDWLLWGLTALTPVMLLGCLGDDGLRPLPVVAMPGTSAAAAATPPPVAISPAVGTAQHQSASRGTAAAPPSHAYGLWQPSRVDSCSQAIHDQYAVVGPDGKRYPTWHPPMDPGTGCTFGHEHGRDPKGSRLYPRTGGLPFGVANEALDRWDPHGSRHEDHVGHKVEWENGVRLQRSDRQQPPLDVTCDFLLKLHQGTHSADAFTNNLHELVYYVGCDDGTQVEVTLLVPFGRPGEFTRACDEKTVVAVGPAVPATSPEGEGGRFIPDRWCVEQYLLVPKRQTSDYARAFGELWAGLGMITQEDGTLLAYFDPYFLVSNPSRYYDPTQPGGLGRTHESCYLVTPTGERVRGGDCDDDGQLRDVAYDDPQSVFNGTGRQVVFNQTVLMNPGGPTIWYTDPFGGHAQTRPFPGAVQQYLAAKYNEAWGELESQFFGAERHYGGSGVHAPN